MSSFGTKLSRLRAPPPPEESAPPAKASLDELRDKIAAILGRAPARPEPSLRRAESDAASWIEHAFVEEDQPLGTLYVSRKPTPKGHRVGSVPVWAARTAESALLALLALDPSLAGCDLDRALYLDTETTGLSGGTGTVPFLVGLGFYDPEAQSFIVEQVLLRKYADEPAMVEHVRARIEAASVIVTFNGKSFDMPLLRSRAIMSRLAPLPERPHLDLLHVARRIHRHRLASCALVRLEDRILGRARIGDVAGADICAIYHHYVRTNDIAALEPVVEHNALDVISMLALVGLYGEPLEQWARPSLNGSASDALRSNEPRVSPTLVASDLAAAASVLKRAGDLDRAHALASVSIDRGAGASGYRARGDVEKARGDKARALSDYEAAAEAFFVRAGDDMPAVSDAGERGALHLELAKLYEHHARAYDKALAMLARGTNELQEKSEARAVRLQKKIAAPKKAAARRTLVTKKERTTAIKGSPMERTDMRGLKVRPR